MDLTTAIDWASDKKSGVLITLRKDGRAQSSDIVYAVKDGVFLISLTNTRAKTKNMLRDPRVVLHLTAPDSWTYLSFDGTVELSEVTTSADDETSNALVALYEAIAGEPHSNWDEFRKAMIDEGRQVATFTPTSVVGQIN